MATLLSSGSSTTLGVSAAALSTPSTRVRCDDDNAPISTEHGHELRATPPVPRERFPHLQRGVSPRCPPSQPGHCRRPLDSRDSRRSAETRAPSGDSLKSNPYSSVIHGVAVHGLSTGTFPLSKSAVLRDTTVSPWCSAVAAMRRSGCTKVWPDFSSVFDQKAPLQHDVFIDRKDSILEHRSQLVREPIVELHPSAGVIEELDPEPNLGEGHDADIQKVQCLAGDKVQDVAVRTWPSKLR